MKLKYCSLTGADDAVDINSLSQLALDYPFLETAILLMPSRAGTPRFPSLSWIKKFAAEYKGKHRAMHLCGDAFLGFINGDAKILNMMQGFQRIQLNLKFGDVEGKYAIDDLVAQVKRHTEFTFILQYGHDKKGLLPLFADIPNHAVLFDESAGRGISPDSWPAPLAGHFCGYAGGMNPDNVAANIDMIRVVAAGHDTWIDMESGIRTNDAFDLDKCRRVLDISAKDIG